MIVGSNQVIGWYAHLCLQHDKEPNRDEMLTLVLFGVIPNWIQELGQ